MILNSVLISVKIRSNIIEISETEACVLMLKDLKEANVHPKDVSFSQINDRYKSLNGSVAPRTIGAVQDALLLLWEK